MGSVKQLVTGSRPRCLPSVATMSLGSPSHPLDVKLRAAASKGFQGVELYWDDLANYSFSLRHRSCDDGAPASSTDDMAMLLAASEIAKLARLLRLRIVSLQPFRNFDGLRNSELRERRLQEFELWLAVARELGTDIIGVPSTLPTVKAEDYTGDSKEIAQDLRELCRLAGEHGVRIAYENLCFAAHVKDWEQAWEGIRRAGQLDNLLFLPDTFNICGRTYMDPEAVDGKTAHAEEDLQSSLERLVDAVPMAKMPVLQVADAELLGTPLSRDHPWRIKDGLVTLMALSRNARLFPFEKSGYLPVLSVIRALAGAGWEGWVSMEVFSRTTAVGGEETIWEHVDRAWASWEKLADYMAWPVRPLVDDI